MNRFEKYFEKSDNSNNDDNQKPKNHIEIAIKKVPEKQPPQSPQINIAIHVNSNKKENVIDLKDFTDINQIKVEFDTPEDFRNYQLELQKKFQKLPMSGQDAIIDNVSQQLKHFNEELETAKTEEQKQEINMKIRQATVLISILHSIYHQSNKE